MPSQMAEIIRQLVEEKGIPEKSVLAMIEDSLKAAYSRHFGRGKVKYDNAVVKFEDDLSDVSLFSRKLVLDGIWDPVIEIELEDALKLSPDCEVGDELDILIDPREFDFSTIQLGKQTSRQNLSEIQKNRLYEEFKDKVGEMIRGRFQREDTDKGRGTIYVDIRNDRVECMLPKKNQSEKDEFRKGDWIDALVVEIKKPEGKRFSGLQLILSRSDPELVRKIMEQEIPETYDKTVEIHKIVREPGKRTKVAVYASREDVDPVGACVGPKGARIKNIIAKLSGERVDILRFDPDPVEFIKNALVPAVVLDVVILNEEKKQALAIVNRDTYPQAIGVAGVNVRLANRLVGWNIDVKTEDQYEEYEHLIADYRKAAQDLFSDEVATINSISEIPGIDKEIVAVLKENGIEDIEQFLDAVSEGRLENVDGLSAEAIASVESLINEVVEFVEDEPADSEGVDFMEEEEYFCPECNARITTDMTACPNCGVEFTFEEEE